MKEIQLNVAKFHGIFYNFLAVSYGYIIKITWFMAKQSIRVLKASLVRIAFTIPNPV